MEEPNRSSEEQKEQDNEIQHKLLLEERERKFKPVSHFSYYAYGALIIFLLALFLVGIIPRLTLQEKINQLASERSLPKVAVVLAKGIDKPVELTLPSSLDAINITPIWARVDGYIRAFLADIGDIVKEGDILAEIETP